METKTKIIEPLLDKAVDLAKTSLELAKLKAIDKGSDVISSFIPHSVVFIILGSFILFLNLGLSLWLGDILGEIWLGFFIVAGFYGLIAFVMHFFMHEWFKKLIRNLIIKQLLK